MIFDTQEPSAPPTFQANRRRFDGDRALTIRMPAGCNTEPSLAERIERALVVIAYFIELDGDVHLPMYEKFEAELAELKRREATRERARRLLSLYAEPRRPEGDALEEL